MQETWIEKIYAGLLGKIAGVRLGAPIENPLWTYDRLREQFGEITGYLRACRHFAADDDINGPIIFLRTLTDAENGLDFTAKEAGETWLNYARCGHGMFWWGGEDVSTEHRCYMNLRRGVPAPQSGSIAQNGPVAAQQIGGQIFVDTWGLVCPGDPARAASMARTMASVSHDGEALHGAAFMAACVAGAFTARTVDQVLDAGLSALPAACVYRQAVDAVRRFHAEKPEDFRACRDFVDREWGNDRFPGGYHVIPNAAICVLALLYGGGRLDRTIEIACMCGFDTDCNAGNTGAIAGVLGGLDGIPARYRDPINDSVVLSSVAGYLNIVDCAAYAKELAVTACRLRGEDPPAWLRCAPAGEILMDFSLPGSTHGLALSEGYFRTMRNGRAPDGSPCLELLIDGKLPRPADLYFKAFYTEDDFDDARYEQVFAPRAYPGQRVSCRMLSSQEAPAAVTVTPFVTMAMNGGRAELAPITLRDGAWQDVAFTVPDLEGDEAHEIGWRFSVAPEEPPWVLGKVYLADITVTGPMDYTIDTAIQYQEFGQITPFSFNDCEGRLADGALVVTTDRGGQAFTGNYYTRDGSIEGQVVPLTEGGAMLLLRGQGCRRFYALGLTGPDRAAICRYDAGVWTELAQCPYAWKPGETLSLRAEAAGDRLSLSIDGRSVLEARDGRFSYGMSGLCHPQAGASRWTDLRLRGTV